MKKSSLIFAVLAVASLILFTSCGGDKKENEPDEPKTEEITRVKDTNGKIFIENGTLVEANTSFTSTQLQQALSETDWVRSRCFLYDNTHISSTASFTSQGDNTMLAYKLLKDRKTLLKSGRTLNYVVSGKTITIDRIPEMSTIYPTTYTVVAVDYSESLKRIVTDITAIPFALIPEGYGIETQLRIIWERE